MSGTDAALVQPRLLADAFAGGRTRDVLLTAGYTGAIALGAQLAVPLPFTPVPLTAQTLVVLLGAAALGARRATAGAALYGALGAVGVPWFAVSGGASFGYLLGFVVAALLVGRLASAGWAHTLPRTAAAMLIGSIAILALGTVGLAIVLRVDLATAFGLGFLPFVVGDLAKVAVASITLPTLARRLG